MFEAIRKLSRNNRIVYIMGKLSVLAHDDGPEFDSLIERIIKRLEHYEAQSSVDFCIKKQIGGMNDANH